MPRHTASLLHAPLALVVFGIGMLAGVAPAAAQSQPAGPIQFEEQSPLQRLSYTPMTEGADPVAPGRVQAGLVLEYSNIFEHDSTSTETLFLDMESLLTTATVRYGLRGGWEVGGRVTLQTSGGGFLDPFLIWYHRTLGLPDDGRASYPQNAYRAQLKDASGRVRLQVPQRRLSVDDVRLFAKWRAYRSADGRRVLSLRAVGEVPGDQNTIGGKRANLALMALGRVSWTRYAMYGTLGAATTRVGPEIAPLVRPYSWFLMVGGERSLDRAVSAVVEVTAEAARMRGFHDPQVDGTPVNVVFGFAGREGSGWRWNAGLQEDVPADRPSVDFTFCAGASRSW